MTKIFITEREAATHLGISARTLARWRYIRKGPRAHRFNGSIRYKQDDLNQFAADCTIGGE